MRIKTIGWARLALKQQVEIFGGDQVSLDSLWRAAESPEGQDPRTWSELAAPLLLGFASYLGKLDGCSTRSADPSRLLWIWEDDSKDPGARATSWATSSSPGSTRLISTAIPNDSPARASTRPSVLGHDVSLRSSPCIDDLLPKIRSSLNGNRTNGREPGSDPPRKTIVCRPAPMNNGDGASKTNTLPSAHRQAIQHERTRYSGAGLDGRR